MTWYDPSMTQNKRQTFDEFKDKVYDDIKFLEYLDKDIADELKPSSNREGCYSILFSWLLSKYFLPHAYRKARETRKVDELSSLAFDLLARSHVKVMLCEHLDESVKLPIDVANVISPVLYKIAESEDFPFDTMLWALISKKIADRGIKNYCI